VVPVFQTALSGSFPAAAVIASGAAGVALMACAFYGWGRLARRLAGLPKGTWPVSVALGLASVIFLGGVLNLCRLAYPAALAGIVLAGLALTAMTLWRDGAATLKFERNWWSVLWAVGLAGLTGFAIVTQLAPSLYNPSDDFQYFFAHAIRMVETGTLYGSPLNTLGGEGLGAQAFLQGFIVGFFPINFINAADAVFCFFLCLALAGSVAFGRPALWPAAMAGTLAVVLIDPQYVNVSSLYSMAALVSALMIITVDARETGAAGWRQAAAPALFYAGAIALKNTGIVFLELQFCIAAAAACWVTGNARASLWSAARIAAWSLLFLAPWLLLYAPYYLTALTHPVGVPSIPVPEVIERLNPASLFSPSATYYGASFLAYTGLALGLFACALWAALQARHDPARHRSLVALASAAGAGGASYLFWVCFGPHLQESISTLRYSVPVLIGAVSAALPLLGYATARRNFSVCAGVTVLVVALFAFPAWERLGTLLHQRSQLAFLHHWGHGQLSRILNFESLALQERSTPAVQQLQARIPPGEPLLAWTATPFRFDYRRNAIIDMNIAGMAQRWGRIPKVRYIIWQYGGFMATSEAGLEREIAVHGRRMGHMSARALDVMRYLQGIPAAKTLADQDDMVLIQLDDDVPPPPN
jgi:hypothetical protein